MLYAFLIHTLYGVAVLLGTLIVVVSLVITWALWGRGVMCWADAWQDRALVWMADLLLGAHEDIPQDTDITHGTGDGHGID